MTHNEYNKSVDAYADGVYRFILKNIKDGEDARDIVQEAFTKLWEKRKNVDTTKVKSYLFTTAYRTMLDWIKKNKPQPFSHESSQWIEPNHSDHYSDVQEILNEAVDKLPKLQKAVVTLRDYEGYSYQEIGEILQLSTSKVKVYIFRARKFLKEYIGSMEILV